VKWISSFFLFLFLFLQLAIGQDLEQFLDLDRFAYYTTDMAQNLKKKGHEQLAHALEELGPEDLWKFVNSDSAFLIKIKDGHNYDELLQTLVKKNYPELTATVGNIQSNYNFFKNKLNESFNFRQIENIEARAKLVEATKPQSYAIPKIDASAMTLNAEHYISNRQTRAILWDVVKNKRDIEFYLEDLQSALTSIESRGGKIVGEVQTLANNYNKNYLVYYSKENRYAHVITDISGTDRLYHLTKQLSIIKWNGVSGAERLNENAKVFGPLNDITEHETKKLKQLLEVMPKADHVILGQKGAMERNVRTAQKVELVLKQMEKDPNILSSLDKSEQKIIQQLQDSGDLFESMHNASKWDGIFKKLEAQLPELADTFDFNIDLNSHSIADVTLKSSDGKVKRIRLVSNVWGNEAQPIADALIETGHTKFTYIGTAGALSQDYKVGDVVTPKRIQLHSGKYIDLPPPSFSPKGLKHMGNLAQVASLFDETQLWLKNQKSIGNDLVEMEVGYLADSFSKKTNVDFNVFLLVSDMVGEEGETLDQASSSVRKKSQLSTLHEIFKHEKAQTVIPPQVNAKSEIDRLIMQIDPKRSALSLYQVKQVIKKQFANVVPDRLSLEDILNKNTSFTPSLLQKRIETAQTYLNELYQIAKKEGESFSLFIDDALYDGSYHPKQKINLVFSVDSKLDFEYAQELLEKNPEFKKVISLSFQENTGKVTTASNEFKKLDLLKVYNDNAMNEGALLGKISRSGNLSFAVLPKAVGCNIRMLDMSGVIP
jgi:nucleoside phosphorylase